jgi:ketosteroid isomerase-like protein
MIGHTTGRSEVDMDSKQTVMALYGAYASGDADQIASLLHDEVVWTEPAGNATQVALGLGRPV